MNRERAVTEAILAMSTPELDAEHGEPFWAKQRRIHSDLFAQHVRDACTAAAGRLVTLESEGTRVPEDRVVRETAAYAAAQWLEAMARTSWASGGG